MTGPARLNSKLLAVRFTVASTEERPFFSAKNQPHMDTQSLDQPTLRIHLDRLNHDKTGLTARLNEEIAKLDTLKATIEQYKGALSYNQNLIDSVSKEIEALNAAAFSGKAKSLREAVEEKTVGPS